MNRALVLSSVIATTAFFAFYGLPRGIDNALSEQGSLGGTAPVNHPQGSPRSESTYQGKTARWWARRAVQARRDANARGRTIRRLQNAQLRSSAHFFEWLKAADCVHEREARWDYNGPTYDGGMQADKAFQDTYAPDLIRRYHGPAYLWPWYAQLQMAYRGWLFRGWDPWPNTARACGLR